MWSPEFVGENRPGRTVVAPWQEYWYDDQFGKRGQAWAPGGALLPRQVVHRRVHGRPLPEGRLVPARERGRGRGPVPARRGQPRQALRRLRSSAGRPSSSPAPTTTSTAASTPRATTRGWCCTTTCTRSSGTTWRTSSRRPSLPAFQQTPYAPEPYLEGAYVFKYGGKYYLLHAAWNRTLDQPRRQHPLRLRPARRRAARSTSTTRSSPSPTASRARTPSGGPQASAPATTTSSRTTAASCGRRSSATRRFGYWSDPSRIADAAVPGVVRLEWTGPEGNRLYVQRRHG